MGKSLEKNHQPWVDEKLKIMKSVKTKQNNRSILNFDRLKGFLDTYYSEVFNAWSQAESRVFNWYLMALNDLVIRLKKPTRTKALRFQLMPINLKQRNKNFDTN